MYLARQQINGKTYYAIRESYPDGDIIKSRELVDLGLHPDQYIIYPGGSACYFHEDVYDQLNEKDITPDDDELEKIYRPLLDKSRDEIEQMFLQMENVLDEDEKKNYTFVIFNIPDHFAGKLARNFPQALSQAKVDDFFLDEVCRLDADNQFARFMRYDQKFIL